jgi:hypothetical protein
VTAIKKAEFGSIVSNQKGCTNIMANEPPCLQAMVAGFRLDERYLTPDGSCADSDEKKDIAYSEPLDECVTGVN